MPGKAAPATAPEQAKTGKSAASERVSSQTARFSEHKGTGRLLTQRGLFAGPSDLVSKDLYAEIVEGVATRRRETVILEPSARVSGNTYFGRFPASYWQRWTTAKSVAVEAEVSGSGQLAVRASDMEGEPRTVTVRTWRTPRSEHVARRPARQVPRRWRAVADLETESGIAHGVERALDRRFAGEDPADRGDHLHDEPGRRLLGQPVRAG